MKRLWIYKTKTLSIFLGVICILGLFVAYVYTKGQKNNQTEQGGRVIVLSDAGFRPAEITVRVGTTVLFRSTGEKDFWPASDLHPTHQIYPEFDPKRPLAPTETWSFTFTKPGRWKYHDHLNPLAVGTVVVESATGAVVDDPDCVANPKQTQCYEKLMDNTLKTQGLDAAFEVMAQLYSTEPIFALECHAYAHKLGQAAYQTYSSTGHIQLSPKASYCGYGFYHGFLETLLHTSGDIQEAKDFCADVGKELSAQTSDAEGACYHGIGHGIVDGSDPTAWGNIDKMMQPGMQLCQQVAGDDHTPYGKLYRCVSGVYNALEILSMDSKYKLDSIVSNPFALCPSQPAEFYEACYTNMLPAQMRLRKNNFTVLAQDIKKIAVGNIDAVNGPVLSSLFHEYIRLHLTETGYGVTEAVRLCKSLGALRLYCVDGLTGGHMKYGRPQEEYAQALQFCRASVLAEDERDRCFAYILPRLRIWYTEEKKISICDSVPQKYRHYCSP